MFVYVPGAPALDLSKGMPNASYWNGKESKPQIWWPEVAHSALINVLFTSILVQVFCGWKVHLYILNAITCPHYRNNCIKLWCCPSKASWIISLCGNAKCKGWCFALSVPVSSGTELHLSLCCRLRWAPRMPSGSCRWRECNSASQSWCCICQTRFDDHWIYGHILT